MPLPDKRRVLDAVLEKVSEVIALAAQAAEGTRKDATHEEAKAENDKDTRALEQSYLARGQAMRTEQAIEEREVLKFLPIVPWSDDRPISAGALVRLEDEEGAERVLFMLPHAGGTEVEVDDEPILVVTPVAALGAALLGRAVGDEVELRHQGKKREYVITEVR